MMMWKEDPSFPGGRNSNQYSHSGNKYGKILRKLKLNLPYDLAIPFFGICPKDSASSSTDLLNNVHCPPYSQQPGNGNGVNVLQPTKMQRWDIYTIEYYSPVKKKHEIIKSAGKWIDLGKIILSEMTQTQKDKYCILSHARFLAPDPQSI